MECQASDSKKILEVFDASKRKRGRRKREGLDESNSVITDDSHSLAQTKMSIKPGKASLQDLSTAQGDGPPGNYSSKRDRDSSPSVSPTPDIGGHRSPRRHRRPQRDGNSLALKAGLVSTPRSESSQQEGDGNIENPDQNSVIYKLFEDAIKKDKRKHRHSRHHEEQRNNRDSERDRNRDRDDRDHDRDRDRDYEETNVREHRHRHRRRRDDVPSRDHDKPAKEESVSQVIDQARLFETFAKLCTTITEKTAHIHPPITSEVIRSQSHKSLQCEVVSNRDVYDVDQRPVRLRSREPSLMTVAPSRCRVRSQENMHDSRSRLHSPNREERKEKLYPSFDKPQKYSSKIDVPGTRARHGEDRYRDYPPACPARSCTNHAYRQEDKDYREYDERRDPIRQRRSYDEDKRRYCEHKTSRSFDIHREPYDDERLRRTSRSDSQKKRYDELREMREKRFEDRDGRDRRYDDRKYYDDKDRDARERLFSHLPSKDRRSRRNLERFERTSIVSREEDYNRDRDRYSERERDSGPSVADGENSTVSGRSNYLKFVKQELSEQREEMVKMMKLWKELMRCFKGMPTVPGQGQGQDKAIHEAANAQESAAAHLRLWRECMRRYETVARDVGDTDARLMEEITKQRGEMAEMATLWQECLQRYRDMSSDFDSLKRQLVTESPSRPPAVPPPPPLACPEGESAVTSTLYRAPPGYHQTPMGPLGPMGAYRGSPMRARNPGPPAWWWCGDEPARRRSSPESRASHSRDHHRRRRKEREETAYKEKSSKPTAGHSEHRRRKR